MWMTKRMTVLRVALAVGGLLAFVGGCKSQSDTSAQDEARKVAQRTIHTYLAENADALGGQVADALVRRGEAEAADKSQITEKFATWAKAKPQLSEYGSGRHMDAFSFLARPPLTRLSTAKRISMTFTVVVPVDDDNKVADAGVLLAKFKVDNESVELR